MVDPKLVELLKQGVEQWNEWRQQHRDEYIDLHNIVLLDADLRGANLLNVDLSNSRMYRANLCYASLYRTNLSYANLGDADLSEANLSYASLHNASLYSTDLRYACLANAHLTNAHLNGAYFNDADLRNADLLGANLSNAYMHNANLFGTKIGNTVFAHIDLRMVKGLTEIDHQGPSHIQLHTVQLPQDGSALHFLRGAGVPDEWIDFWRTTMMHPIQYHSCFISYSSKDETLARRLHADLQAQGVRCWFAPEDMKTGAKIRPVIDQMIHQQEKFLLLLSEHSINSDWVEDEVEAALEKERRQQREVLFPVRLDDAVMHTTQAWATKLRRTRHIGDFTNWTDPQAYERAFERLLRDLKAL